MYTTQCTAKTGYTLTYNHSTTEYSTSVHYTVYGTNRFLSTYQTLLTVHNKSVHSELGRLNLTLTRVRLALLHNRFSYDNCYKTRYTGGKGKIQTGI